jgi:hypothetical protein
MANSFTYPFALSVSKGSDRIATQPKSARMEGRRVDRDGPAVQRPVALSYFY